MSNVVPFTLRPDTGGWSAGERARLSELADRLAADGIHVRVVYGATDQGDPWCVFTDENERPRHINSLLIEEVAPLRKQVPRKHVKRTR